MKTRGCPDFGQLLRSQGIYMDRKKVELLAPAGNPEGFYGAIHAGADAVYLGGTKFGARAYADNFSEEELVGCIRYAHILGRRIYLTVNTLVKESEFQELYGYLMPYYEAGLDGVIVQDLGALLFIRDHFPGMELHASTQMTITGSHGAGWLKELGVCRIVPARELSLDEIRTMKEDTGLEIETFIHGAMCYCYSGQCLFSSILGGRSGNRGRCAQPCRLPYTVEMQGNASRECYPLSLRDMCTIEHIPELIGAGIDSFKIEGRMKKPEYTAGVTSIYRKYIDAYYDRPQEKQQIKADDLKALSCLYIRSERQDGYYHKHNGADMVTLDSPAYSGSDEELLGKIRKCYLEKRPLIPVDIYADFHLDEPARLTLIHGSAAVTATGSAAGAALKQPVTEENISRQLQKLGGTAFEAGEMNISMDEGIFYPLKAINELRREAVTLLENELIRGNGLCAGREAPNLPSMPSDGLSGKQQETASGMSCASPDVPLDVPHDHCILPETGGLVLTLRTPAQLSAAAGLVRENAITLRRICLDGDMFLQDRQNQFQDAARSLDGNTEIFIAMPYILRKKDEAYLRELLQILSQKEFSGCMVRSPEGYAYLKEAGYQGKIALDAGMYLWNRYTMDFWKSQVQYYCLPLELNAREQKMLLSSGPARPEKIIYGRIPMMITANCVAKTTGRCRGMGKEQGSAQLCDRYQKHFPVELNCLHCMNIIFNSVPLSLHSECIKWKGCADLRLDFTVEDERQTGSIIRYFYQLADSGIQTPPPYAGYTRGHEKRGVQ